MAVKKLVVGKAYGLLSGAVKARYVGEWSWPGQRTYVFAPLTDDLKGLKAAPGNFFGFPDEESVISIWNGPGALTYINVWEDK